MIIVDDLTDLLNKDGCLTFLLQLVRQKSPMWTTL